jgi:hypothetical protein
LESFISFKRHILAFLGTIFLIFVFFSLTTSASTHSQEINCLEDLNKFVSETQDLKSKLLDSTLSQTDEVKLAEDMAKKTKAALDLFEKTPSHQTLPQLGSYLKSFIDAYLLRERVKYTLPATLENELKMMEQRILFNIKRISTDLSPLQKNDFYESIDQAYLVSINRISLFTYDLLKESEIFVMKSKFRTSRLNSRGEYRFSRMSKPPAIIKIRFINVEQEKKLYLGSKVHSEEDKNLTQRAMKVLKKLQRLIGPLVDRSA